MKLGDAFRRGTLPKIKVLHMWIVISDPAAHPDGSFVVVSVTMDDVRAGRECILQPGDHPWLTKESFVSFGDAELLTAKEGTDLVSRFGKGVITESPLDSAILKRIVGAAKIS